MVKYMNNTTVRIDLAKDVIQACVFSQKNHLKYKNARKLLETKSD